ncbi:MAG: hypothetical protein ACKOK8_17035, partial [Planctomycetia bacterium]
MRFGLAWACRDDPGACASGLHGHKSPRREPGDRPPALPSPADGIQFFNSVLFLSTRSRRSFHAMSVMLTEKAAGEVKKIIAEQKL